jgi:hypothetical protein
MKNHDHSFYKGYKAFNKLFRLPNFTTRIATIDCFYALFDETIPKERVSRMINMHFYNSTGIWGDWMNLMHFLWEHRLFPWLNLDDEIILYRIEQSKF